MMTSNERAEYELLQLAAPDGKFAIGVGFPQPNQSALDRLQRRQWIALVDISAILTNPEAGLMRIFLASDVAMEWFRIQKLWRGDPKFACAIH
jgi:hypothetical protein